MCSPRKSICARVGRSFRKRQELDTPRVTNRKLGRPGKSATTPFVSCWAKRNISDLPPDQSPIQRSFASLRMTTALRVLKLEVSLGLGAWFLGISRRICGGHSSPLIFVPYDEVTAQAPGLAHDRHRDPGDSLHFLFRATPGLRRDAGGPICSHL